MVTGGGASPARRPARQYSPGLRGVGQRVRYVGREMKDDPTLRWLLRHAGRQARNSPHTVPAWLIGRVPIVRWLPHYDWRRWTIWDLIAGLTVGLMLVPQSIAYASVADVPVQYGLFAAYFPPLIYAVTGTSKDLTVGPTAVVSLLTGETIRSMPGQDPATIAIALAFTVGIFSLALGVLHLGIILDFFSGGVLSGYTTGAAVVIAVQQVPKILGQKTVSTRGKVGTIIHGILTKLGDAHGRDIAFSIGSFIALIGLQYAGKYLGAGNSWWRRAIWFSSVARNTLVVVVFTAISYGINKDRRQDPLITIIGHVPAGLYKPKVPDVSLFSDLVGKSVTVFLAAVLEHVAIGKAFARKDKTELDFSQELISLGACNILGSFFGAIPVTGSFSRTAVNRQSGSKSPLSGLLCAVVVIVSVVCVTPAFYWIPSSTLGVVIFLAVIQLIAGPRVFYQLWRISFWDFIASQLALWLTIFYSVEVGILTAVGFSLVVLLWRIARPKIRTLAEVSTLEGEDLYNVYADADDANIETGDIQPHPGILILRLEESLVFSNYRFVSNTIMNRVYAYTAGELGASVRTFNSNLEERVRVIRQCAGTYARADELPRLRALILDFSAVNHLDSAGLQCLHDVRAALTDYAAVEHFELHFVCVHKGILRIMELADVVNPIDRPERAPPLNAVENALRRRWTRTKSSLRRQSASLSHPEESVDSHEAVVDSIDNDEAASCDKSLTLPKHVQDLKSSQTPADRNWSADQAQRPEASSRNGVRAQLRRPDVSSGRAPPLEKQPSEASLGNNPLRAADPAPIEADGPYLNTVRPTQPTNSAVGRSTAENREATGVQQSNPAISIENAMADGMGGLRRPRAAPRPYEDDRHRPFLDQSAEKFFIHLSIDRALRVVLTRLAVRPPSPITVPTVSRASTEVTAVTSPASGVYGSSSSPIGTQPRGASARELGTGSSDGDTAIGSMPTSRSSDEADHVVARAPRDGEALAITGMTTAPATEELAIGGRARTEATLEDDLDTAVERTALGESAAQLASGLRAPH